MVETYMSCSVYGTTVFMECLFLITLLLITSSQFTITFWQEGNLQEVNSLQQYNFFRFYLRPDIFLQFL